MYGAGELGYFLSELMPVARRGELKASAICTSTSEGSGAPKAAIIDLEHHELLHVLVILPYEKRLLSWSFGARQFTRESPALFAPSENTAPCEIRHQEFLLKPGRGWRRVAGDDPTQFLLYSDEKKTSVVISVVVRGPIPLDRLLGVANHLAESRLHIEQQSDPARRVTIGYCNVELKENGQVGHVDYVGHADDGHIFRFMGWVSQRKIFSFRVSSETSDNESFRNIFNELLGGLRLCIP